MYKWPYLYIMCTECVIAVRFVAHIGQPYKVGATTRRLNIISCSIFVTAPCIIYIILWPCMGQKCIYIYIIIYNNNNNYTKCVYYMTFCIIPDTCILLQSVKQVEIYKTYYTVSYSCVIMVAHRNYKCRMYIYV